jgi:hypothetical protein
MRQKTTNRRGIMVAFAADILGIQIDSLRRQSEAWERIAERPAACRELEEVIAFTNFVYERLSRIEEEWSDELDRTGADPKLDDARAVERLYRNWCERARSNLGHAAVLERAGHEIKGADDLRRAMREVEGILSMPVDRLRRAAESVREGRTRPLGEIRDALRRRLDERSRGVPG